MVSFDTVQPGWCGIDQDDSFGPVLKGCRENFDFTLVFEESILSLAPSAFLLLLVPARLVQLWGSRKKVRRGFWQLSRSIAFCILLSQIVFLVQWTKPDVIRTRLSVATAAVTIIEAISIFILSFMDHNRSVRPSTILQLYLSLSLLFSLGSRGSILRYLLQGVMV
ncbi:hypothetical protein sscle_02g021200 [Sclerotinia sclerotiorum 1980 UF-70]|uniref:ABC transporter TMD0 domain-containing protein n=1 Tax=Sclerotinia sclerotiorum (strain ATCC 18683 / 1980 / Ss-1) TaxID=665079 RepID=A0A1D9PXD5_SCLS1|nr:hypothetical protein sscle_02g021200 [Sclerotinia sclerotiorum 1980 UF-70]